MHPVPAPYRNAPHCMPHCMPHHVTHRTRPPSQVLAYGFVLNQHAYLRDAWCQLDFVVVMLAWIPILIPSFGNYSVVRSVRALRPLRALKRVPGMPALISALCVSWSPEPATRISWSRTGGPQAARRPASHSAGLSWSGAEGRLRCRFLRNRSADPPRAPNRIPGGPPTPHLPIWQACDAA